MKKLSLILGFALGMMVATLSSAAFAQTVQQDINQARKDLKAKQFGHLAR